METLTEKTPAVATDAALDRLISERIDLLLDQRLEAKLAEIKATKTPSMTIIATKGTLDWAYPPFILASTAAALGWDVSIFFTFYGLELLKKDLRKLKVSPLGNPAMPMKMPMGPAWFKSIQLEHPERRAVADPALRDVRDEDDEEDGQEERRRRHRRAAQPLHRSRRQPDRLPDDRRPVRLQARASSSPRSRSTSAPRRSCRWRRTPTSACSSEPTRRAGAPGAPERSDLTPGRAHET